MEQSRALARLFIKQHMKTMIQITSGKGPAECCRVVAKVQEALIKEARQHGFSIEVLDSRPGDLNGTLQSSTLLLEGKQCEAFLKSWRGTIQWIAQSPYRRFHKRKNWFVGVEIFEMSEKADWNPKDVVFETMRGGGPGGQNVNKVETAVRGKHVPSGIQVVAMESRSQLQNRKLCTERLQAKVKAWELERLASQQQSQWLEHHQLERGNPVRTFRERL
jgi:peptide chain release factor